MRAEAGIDVKVDGAHEAMVRLCPVDPPQRRKPMIPAKQASLAMVPTVTTVRGSLGPTTASLSPGPVATAAGEGRDAAAAGAQETRVQRCLVTPPRRQTPEVPAKQASLAMDPAVTTVRGSLGPTTASLGPSLVATAAGKGRDAAAEGAQENWVQRCLVTPSRPQGPAGVDPAPVFPAKQASLAMDPTVTTVRGSLGPTASLKPGPVATAAGEGGGAGAAGVMVSGVRRFLTTPVWRPKRILGQWTVRDC